MKDYSVVLLKSDLLWSVVHTEVSFIFLRVCYLVAAVEFITTYYLKLIRNGPR